MPGSHQRRIAARQGAGNTRQRWRRDAPFQSAAGARRLPRSGCV